MKESTISHQKVFRQLHIVYVLLHCAGKQFISQMRHKDPLYLALNNRHNLLVPSLPVREKNDPRKVSDSIQGPVLYVFQILCLPMATVAFKKYLLTLSLLHHMWERRTFSIVFGSYYFPSRLESQHMIHLKYLMQVSIVVGTHYNPINRVSGTQLYLCQSI